MGNSFSRSSSAIWDALFGLYGANVDDPLQLFAGTYEVEECQAGEGEADLPKKASKCKKNPGHKGFIPIKNFTIKDLPAGCPKEVFDLTKALGDITVRIAVKLTSEEIPQSLPKEKNKKETNLSSENRKYFTNDNEIKYSHGNKKGTNTLRLGTGRVWRVAKFTSDMDNTLKKEQTCPCPVCAQLGTPSTVWWSVIVTTASHLVFNNSEALKSTCRLWYDDVESPVVEMYGCESNMSDDNSDWCLLSCATHDPKIGERLEEMVRKYDGLCLSLENKYKGRTDEDKLTIIVSHPHGCPKQVSLGHWVHRVCLNDKCTQPNSGNTWTRYMYTTQTCTGSSGALVYRLGCKWLSNHRHSGTHNGLNYSGVNVS